jgi:8-oxo-dGTP pyrophosphatase MutT (NUDIX family)
VDNRSYQVTVKGLCFDDAGRVLLTKENSGWWDLPGGRMEHGEDFHSTLSRECREEMGIECRILDSNPYCAWSARNYDGLWKVVLCFRIEFPHMNFTMSDECVSVEFVGAGEFDLKKVAPQIEQLRKHILHSDSAI